MGRTAVVTGAAQGIGRVYATDLARRGYDVVCVDLRESDETVDGIRRAGGSARALVGDLTSPEDVDRIHGEAQCSGRIADVLVNNAGIYPLTPFEEVSFSEWRKVMSVNVDSVFLMCSAFAPAMREQGWGRIVNMASDVFGIVIGGLSHYTASKGAVIGLTRALASELGPDGVTVNAIAPGLVKTEATLGRQVEGGPDEFAAFAARGAIPRAQTPEDLVGMLAFLVSDEAGFITGQTMWIDGGLVRA